MGVWVFLAAQASLSYATPASPARLETATFSAGCFWGVEEFFRKIPGVRETTVGYTGGTMPSPHYEDVSSGRTGHAESVELKFDPTQVSYKNLLILFFKMHDPTTQNQQGNDRGTQYRSAIFYHGKAQERVAKEVLKDVQESSAWKSKIVTQIMPAGPFYKAEESHQKYLVKHPGGYDNHFLRNLSFGAIESH